MPHDAREIANYILDYAEPRGLSITVMTLLKLIYFAHGWVLSKHQKPLIKNNFEAWQYGPVIRIVYDEFKSFKSNPITARATKFNPSEQIRYIAEYNIPPEEAEIINFVVEWYGRLHAYDLSNITHQEGSSWDKIWNKPRGGVTPGMVISNNLIAEDFASAKINFTRQ